MAGCPALRRAAVLLAGLLGGAPPCGAAATPGGGRCADDEGAVSLLQTHSGPAVRAGAPAARAAAAELAAVSDIRWLNGLKGVRLPGELKLLGDLEPPEEPFTVDANGRACFLCGLPDPARTNRTYLQRKDCGNHTMIEHPEIMLKPVIQFSAPAHDGVPATNAWCEFNLQRVCADSIVNGDFLMQGKSIHYPETQHYDPKYCLYNGWLEPEIVALQHDFEGMRSKADELCNTKYLKYGWNSTLTMLDMQAAYFPGMLRTPNEPTPEEALKVGAWTCGMGSAGCDMAYCAYSFCKRADGSIGRYGECEGWDPVAGMPLPSA